LVACGDIISVYPQGITIICLDENDDRSCRIETHPRVFKDLNLLEEIMR